MYVILGIIFFSYVTWLLIYKNNVTQDQKIYFNHRLAFVTVIHIVLVILTCLSTQVPYLKIAPNFIDFMFFGIINHIFGKQALLGVYWQMWLVMTLLLMALSGAIVIIHEDIKYNKKKKEYIAYKAKEQKERNKKAQEMLKKADNAQNQEDGNDTVESSEKNNTPINADTNNVDEKVTQPVKDDELGLVDENMSDEEVAGSGDKLDKYAYVTNGVWLLSNDEHLDIINKKYNTNHGKVGDISLYNYETGERVW